VTLAAETLNVLTDGNAAACAQLTAVPAYHAPLEALVSNAAVSPRTRVLAASAPCSLQCPWPRALTRWAQASS
jgi:hypothetical protein